MGNNLPYNVTVVFHMDTYDPHATDMMLNGCYTFDSPEMVFPESENLITVVYNKLKEENR